MITIKKISWQDTLSIRNVVLRPNKPIENCYFEDDENEENFQLGLFTDEKLAGILSVFKNKYSDFKEKSQYQLRGMAILEEFRNKNYGAKLLLEAEKILNEMNAEMVWCNARITAEKFYNKYQYQSHGDYFEINEIGLHIVMYKNLN